MGTASALRGLRLAEKRVPNGKQLNFTRPKFMEQDIHTTTNNPVTNEGHLPKQIPEQIEICVKHSPLTKCYVN